MVLLLGLLLILNVTLVSKARSPHGSICSAATERSVTFENVDYALRPRRCRVETQESH
jgi:hypothetical protein